MNFQQKLAILNSSLGERKLLADRGRNWGYHETMDLLTFWSDESIQTELEASVRNQHVYEKISAAMQEKGHPRTAEQCRDKVKKLKKDYNDVMSNKTPMSRGMCKYFEIIDKILRNRSLSIEPEVLLDTTIKCDPDGPQTQIPVIVDSYSEQNLSRDPDINSHLSDYSQSPSEISENASPDGELKSDINSLEKPALLSKSLSPPLPNSSNSRIPPSRRRRKVNKAELMLAGIVDRFVETLQNAEARYIELEEKRLRLTMELEEKRQEREENRRREERQHEMQLVQMITQAISSVAASAVAAIPQNVSPCSSSASSAESVAENSPQASKSDCSDEVQIIHKTENGVT